MLIGMEPGRRRIDQESEDLAVGPCHGADMTRPWNTSRLDTVSANVAWQLLLKQISQLDHLLLLRADGYRGEDPA